jgi:hypothetical protein
MATGQQAFGGRSFAVMFAALISRDLAAGLDSLQVALGGTLATQIQDSSR